ncbi:tRNA CCA-pyrophosphorylase [Buchnera aphidicola]|uniref:tRNA CCA-pyrophosphorylase n=1 Tax=Buchnera aphidicola TaxID=9 RepID=UPI003464D1EE
MEVYLVGGAVRDKLLNISNSDQDWVVVGSTPEQLIKKKYLQVGKDFPVFLHPHTKEEYALARTERKFGSGHTGFVTYFSADVTLEEDLMRRDLTINAIAQKKNGNYIDPFNGISDLKLGILRHISYSFLEDPLRVLRVARFSARFSNLGFMISYDTLSLMSLISTSRELKSLTVERIWKETEKAFQTFYPHVYFQVLYICGALSVLFPEFMCLFNQHSFNVNKNFFFKHPILFYLASIAQFTSRVSIRFLFFCFLIAQQKFLFLYKIHTFYDKYITYFIKNFCMRYKVSSYLRKLCMNFSGFYVFLNFSRSQSSENIVLFLNKIDVWRKPKQFYDILIVIKFFQNSLFIKNTLFNINITTFLLKAYHIMKSVSISSIIKLGFQGKEIKYELTKIRCLLFDRWRRINFI